MQQNDGLVNGAGGRAENGNNEVDRAALNGVHPAGLAVDESSVIPLHPPLCL